MLHVLSGGTVGGCEQHVLALLTGLDRRRYEPWLACFEAQPDDAAPMLPLFRAAGVRTIDLRARRRSDPGAFARFARLLRHGHFDIVHVHSFRTELGANVFARLSRPVPRIVRTVHNVDEFYVSRRYAALAQASARGLDRIVAISDAVREYLCREAGLPPDRIVRIYYGIDPTPYCPARGGSVSPATDEPVRRPTIGVIARLAPQKGHRVLIDAIPAIAERFPDLRVRFVGHEELSTVDELRAYALDRGAADRILFEGYRPAADVLPELDVFVLPSRWEGFGLVLVEAMAAARPIVATAVGPVPEVVVDGVTGLLVPPDDPVALASAIVRLLEDPDLASALGRAGRARVESEFRLETMVTRTQALYEELMEKAS